MGSFQAGFEELLLQHDDESDFLIIEEGTEEEEPNQEPEQVTLNDPPHLLQAERTRAQGRAQVEDPSNSPTTENTQVSRATHRGPTAMSSPGPGITPNPRKPKMGGLIELSDKEKTAWTGGKPLWDWSGLSNPDGYHSPNQLRSSSTGTSQKAYNHRKTGRETKFKRTSDIRAFQLAVWGHLTDTGMDTIAYLPDDPETPADMTNVVLNHSRFTVSSAKDQSAFLQNKFDSFDKINDRAARLYLLDSLDPELSLQIEEKLEPKDGFTVAWLQLLRSIQSTSVERFEGLKEQIKNRRPQQYPGQDIEKLAADFRRSADELDSAGQYDHNLTLKMLSIFLLAGGEGNEEFRHPLWNLKANLDNALLEIAYKDKTTANEYMRSNNLTYKHVCEQVEDRYRAMLDRNEWPPARNARDSKAPSQAYGVNILEGQQYALTKADIMALVQDMKRDVKRSGKTGIPPGTCHNCGKPGHWKHDCPLLLKDRGKEASNSQERHSRTNGGRHQRNQRTPKHLTAWKRKPPDPGAPQTKTVKGKVFNWCEKCNRWSTTHSTSTHIGKDKNDTAQANHVTWDPAVWYTPVPTQAASWTTLGRDIMRNTFSFASQNNFKWILYLGSAVMSLVLCGLTSWFIVSQPRPSPTSWATSWEFLGALLAPLGWLIVIWYLGQMGELDPTQSNTRHLMHSQRRSLSPSMYRRYRRQERDLHRSSSRSRSRSPSHRRRHPRHAARRQALRRNEPALEPGDVHQRRIIKILDHLHHRTDNLGRHINRLQSLPETLARNHQSVTRRLHRLETKLTDSSTPISCREGESVRSARTSNIAVGPAPVRSSAATSRYHSLPNTSSPSESESSTRGRWAHSRRRSSDVEDESNHTSKRQRVRTHLHSSSSPSGSGSSSGYHTQPPAPASRRSQTAHPQHPPSSHWSEHGHDGNPLHQQHGKKWTRRGKRYNNSNSSPKSQRKKMNLEINLVRFSDTHLDAKEKVTYNIALQAPTSLKRAMPRGGAFPVIWDSGASVCVSNDRRDFVGPLKSPGLMTTLSGLAKGLRIQGKGEVLWAVADTTGTHRILRLPAFYVPASPVKLLSTSVLIETYPNETFRGNSEGITLEGDASDPTRSSVLARINPENNLPTTTTYRPDAIKEALLVLNTTISTVHKENVNLSDAEKELVRWHQRLGHIGFRRVQSLYALRSA